MAELYTVNADKYYTRDTVIDEYESLVWTERYIDAGEVQLVLPATRELMKLVAPGTLLGLQNARELMLLDTRSVEEGTITATGKTIEAFFNERAVDAFTTTGTAGQILGAVVQRMQDLSGGAFAIPDLRTGLLDDTGDTYTEEIEAGPTYDILTKLANKYNVGMAVYLAESDFGFDLAFSTRIGVNRTIGQGENEVVRFSPMLDNLANVKELVSHTGYKNVALAFPPPELSVSAETDFVRVGRKDAPLDSSSFVQRVVVANVSDITEEMLGQGADQPTTEEKISRLRALMRDRAKAALSSPEVKKTHVIDGEVVADETQYKYYTEYRPGHYTEYRLGDVVEIEGHFGGRVDGVVTEYIRSYDSTGARSYPTVATLPEVMLPDYIITPLLYGVNTQWATHMAYPLEVAGTPPTGEVVVNRATGMEPPWTYLYFDLTEAGDYWIDMPGSDARIVRFYDDGSRQGGYSHPARLWSGLLPGRFYLAVEPLTEGDFTLSITKVS